MARPMPHRPFRVYVATVSVLLLAVSAPSFVQAQAPPPDIMLTQLDTLGGYDNGATAINDHSQIVGFSSDTNGGNHAIL